MLDVELVKDDPSSSAAMAVLPPQPQILSAEAVPVAELLGSACGICGVELHSGRKVCQDCETREFLLEGLEGRSREVEAVPERQSRSREKPWKPPGGWLPYIILLIAVAVVVISIAVLSRS